MAGKMAPVLASSLLLAMQIGDVQATHCPPSGCPADVTDDVEFIQKRVNVEAPLEKVKASEGGETTDGYINGEDSSRTKRSVKIRPIEIASDEGGPAAKPPFVLIPGLGKKVRIPLVRENLRLLRAELGPAFPCLLVIYPPHAQHDPDYAADNFAPCHVRYEPQSMWAVIKSVTSEDLNGSSSIFLLLDDHRLEASSLAKFLAVMENEPVDMVAAGNEPGLIAHGTTYVDFGVCLINMPAFHCMQEIADPETNGIGHGYDNMFTALCKVQVAQCDTCPTVHTSGADQSYNVLEAAAQKERWRAKLGKQAVAWIERPKTSHDLIGLTYQLTGTSHSNALLSASAQLSAVTQGQLHEELAMLSPAQLLRLHKIQRGEVTKAQVEIVLAQYDEDVSWSDVYANIRTVYCKGGANNPFGCIPLPNVGREGHTYLHHIVANYDNLAEWTVFSQAGPPTLGYDGHRLGGGHMLPGISFHDYVLPGTKDGLSRDNGTFFVFTSALHIPTLEMSIRTTYDQDKLEQSREHASQCPHEDQEDRWGPWTNLGWFKDHLAEKCGVDRSQITSFFADFWEKHVQAPMPEGNVAFYAQGARFAASQERIRERPKAFYEQLLALVSTEIDPCANFLNEWTWHYTIGIPRQVPCKMRSHSVSWLELPTSESVRISSPISRPQRGVSVFRH